jgi:hypothetical protein
MTMDQTVGQNPYYYSRLNCLLEKKEIVKVFLMLAKQ